MYSDDTRSDPGAWDHVTAYDPGSERPTEAVLQAIAATTGRDMLVGEPLYTTVDPDALDAVIRAGEGTDVSVSFSYLGCYVRVDRERIRVRRFDGSGNE